MYHRSLALGLLSWCSLLLFRFVSADPHVPPDIICLASSLPADFNPKDCEHILSTFPALHLDLANQRPGGNRPILSLPLRAPPYYMPARFIYKTCRIDFAAFGMFKKQGPSRHTDDNANREDTILGHVHRRGLTISRPIAPLTEEQKAFYLWPEAKETGVAIIRKCLTGRGKLGKARGRFQIPEKGTATRAGIYSSPITTTRSIFYDIKLEPSSIKVDEEYLWPQYYSRSEAGNPHVYDLNPEVFVTPPSSPSHGQSPTSPFDSAH